MFKIYVYFKFIYPYICIYAYMKLKKTVYSTFILVFEDLSWTPFNSINILLQHHFLPSFSSFLFFFWLCYSACGILFPQPVTEHVPPKVETWSFNH